MEMVTDLLAATPWWAFAVVLSPVALIGLFYILLLLPKKKSGTPWLCRLWWRMRACVGKRDPKWDGAPGAVCGVSNAGLMWWLCACATARFLQRSRSPMA